jgi:hypothetical protein
MNRGLKSVREILSEENAESSNEPEAGSQLLATDHWQLATVSTCFRSTD